MYTFFYYISDAYADLRLLLPAGDAGPDGVSSAISRAD